MERSARTAACSPISSALVYQQRKLNRAEFNPQIAALEARIKQLELQAEFAQQFADLEHRLDARQLAQDEAKRGPRGLKGNKGDRGERGHRGEKGDPGDPAKQPVICGWKIDTPNFPAVPFGADGKPLPDLDLYPLFQAILDIAVKRCGTTWTTWRGTCEDGAAPGPVTMSAQLTEAELEIIRAAAAALPPPQRVFQERVAAELKSLPCGMLGPGSLHRIIAACQQTLLKAGAVAGGPSPKHGGKPNAVAAKAGQAGPRGLRAIGRASFSR